MAEVDKAENYELSNPYSRTLEKKIVGFSWLQDSHKLNKKTYKLEQMNNKCQVTLSEFVKSPYLPYN